MLSNKQNGGFLNNTRLIYCLSYFPAVKSIAHATIARVKTITFCNSFLHEIGGGLKVFRAR